MLPHQSYLDAGADALGGVRGLSYYEATHGGRLPPRAGTLTDQLAAERLHVSSNGYAFRLDGLFRTRAIDGELANEAGKRSRRSQAGGADRRTGDDGGHYVAVRFNGPLDAFNHFAQDASFNRGAYRALEDKLAGFQRAGKDVSVRIVPYYGGISQRPYAIRFWYKVDGIWRRQTFSNENEGK